jgi:hypothetical protein
MTRDDFDPVRLLRTVLAAIVVVDLVSFFFFLDEARGIGIGNGELNPFNDLVSRTAVKGVVVLIGVASAVAFGRRPGRLREGLVALGALALLSTAHAQLFGSPWRHLFYSGLCLSGWLLGLLVSRGRGTPTDESYARMGSIALLAAAYLNAGISKMVYGGSEWLSGLPIRAVIVAQDGLVADSIISPYRSWVVATPAVASLFSVATVGFELAAPLMIVGRRTRACVALGLFAMHANIFVLMPILYWESMVLLLVFGLSPDGPRSALPRAAAARRSDDRTFAVGAALLAACAVLAIGHQGRRYAQLEAARALGINPPGPSTPPIPGVLSTPDVAPIPSVSPTPSGPPTSSATPTLTPTPIRQLGPFALGQTLAEEWTVDALAISDGGFVATLSGKPGRAAFEVTCAASPHRSPFDLGAAHIFYSSDLKFHDLETAGWAVQKEVRMAAADKDICDSVARWRMSQGTPQR